MKWPFLTFLMILYAGLKAQDKLYFLNGEILSGYVVEVSPNNITFGSNRGTNTFEKTDLLLLEFSNGRIEVYNRAPVDIFTNDEPGKNIRLEQSLRKVDTVDMISFNSLALCNGEVSLLYEHLLFKKFIGIGAIGSYNFNTVTNVFNIFLVPLENCKKKYDIGGFVHVYTRSNFFNSKLFYGAMVKYSEFSYTALFQDKVGSGSSTRIVTRRVDTNGHHTALIGLVGTEFKLTNSLFLRTVSGLGGYLLKGTYRQQYNARVGPHSDVGFLPKAFLSVQFGFQF